MEAITESQLKVHSKDEIEAKPGKYDDDGFYNLDDGGFYDDHGYFFDKDGFNELGGFYDPETGEYISPEYFDQDYIEALKDYYNDLEAESESESDNEVDEVEYDENTSEGIKMEHCVPALQWLNEQPDDKLFVVKIQNIPRQATEEMLKRKLNKTIKNLVYEKIAIDKQKDQKGNNGVAWISTKDKFTVKQLIKLHRHVSPDSL
jgi:LysM repeat protein